MVSYKDVADLPVGELVSAEDAPVEVKPDTSVIEAAESIEASHQTMAIVEVRGERRSVALHALETAIEQMRVVAHDYHVQDVYADPVRTVSSDTPLRELTTHGVPSETLLVVDPETDQPEAMISRTKLAERVRGLSR